MLAHLVTLMLGSPPRGDEVYEKAPTVPTTQKANRVNLILSDSRSSLVYSIGRRSDFERCEALGLSLFIGIGETQDEFTPRKTRISIFDGSYIYIYVLIAKLLVYLYSSFKELHLHNDTRGRLEYWKYFLQRPTFDGEVSTSIENDS